MKALRKDPAERYARVVDLQDDIRAYAEGGLVGAHRYSLVQRAVKWVKRNRAASIGIAAAVVALSAGVFGMVAYQRAATASEVQRLLDDGESAFNRSDYSRAAEAYTQVLALDAANTDALARLGPAARKAEEARVSAANKKRAGKFAARLMKLRTTAEALPEPKSAGEKSAWYAAHNAVLATARDLARLDDAREKDHVRAAESLIAQLTADANFDTAAMLIDEVAGAMGKARAKRARSALSEARTKRVRDEQQKTRALLARARREDFAEGEFDDMAAALVRMPRPHVVRLLIPALLSESAAERRLSRRAIAMIGDTATTAALPRSAFPETLPEDAWSEKATGSERSYLVPAYRGMRERWLKKGRARRQADSGSDPTVNLDAVQTLSLLLCRVSLETSLEEAVDISWTLGRLRDPRGENALNAKRSASGNTSMFWSRTRIPYKWIPFPESSSGSEPRTAADYTTRGIARLCKGELVSAIADFTTAIELDPKSAVAYNNRGNARQTKGDLDGAIADYTKAMSLAPEDTVTYSNRGVAREDKGDLDGAIADYTKALSLAPEDAVTYSHRGLARQAKGDIDGAIADYTKAIALAPRYIGAYNNRGNARQAKGDLDGAIADYTEALSLDPKNATVYIGRGAARQVKGDLDGAIADYTKAILLDPKDATAYARRGSARGNKGDLDGAIADYTKAISLNPKFAEAYNNRGNARQAKGDFDGAIPDYTKAISLNPKFAEAYINRGLARQNKGDLDGAIADYTKAISLNPKFADAYISRGSVRGANGDIDGAIADWEKALEVAPPNWPRRRQVKAKLRALKKSR